MEFQEKLQELRKRRELTQQELADELYVSRTAISKWESGRGYPSIESLKAIAKFFSVTVDELVLSDQVLTIAEQDQKRKERRFLDLVFGLLDVCMAMLLFFPVWASRSQEGVAACSLLKLGGVQPYLRALYFAAVIGGVVVGVLTLALQSCEADFWEKSKRKISIAVGAASVLLFIAGLQPYGAVFALALLAVKTFLLIKRT